MKEWDELRASLKFEVDVAAGLDVRATTIVALVAAIAALVANFAVSWSDSGSRELAPVVEWVLLALLVFSAIALAASCLLALAAIPAGAPGRSEQLGGVGHETGEGDPGEADFLREALWRQRARNELRAERLRRCLALLAAGIVLVLVQAVTFAAAARDADPECGACEGIQTEISGESPSSSTEEPGEEPGPEGVENLDDLARQFAPVVWVHSKEEYGPASVEAFLADSELTWRIKGAKDDDLAKRGELNPARLGLGCQEPAIGCYQRDRFLATDYTRPHDDDPDRAPGLTTKEGFYLDPSKQALVGEIGVEPQVPIYYEARTGKVTRIAYWFFYGNSFPNKARGGINPAKLFDHEGDWENIEVVLGPSGRPRAVRYFGHGDPVVFRWAATCKMVGDREECGSNAPGRPVVYSALYSHASYASAAETRSRQTRVCAKNFLKRPCAHDLRDRGYLWDPLAAEGGLRDVRAQPWYGFGGAWGSAGINGDTTGPLGPSPYKLPSDPEAGELASVVREDPSAP